eukprot:Skav233335  [mRNA]  locus=scaffold394:56728:59608:- [translate_table: standard]
MGGWYPCTEPRRGPLTRGAHHGPRRRRWRGAGIHLQSWARAQSPPVCSLPQAPLFLAFLQNHPPAPAQPQPELLWQLPHQIDRVPESPHPVSSAAGASTTQRASLGGAG